MKTETFDFWKAYNTLCISLEQAGKKIISDSLKEAQRHATGMTDGWFDFLNAFEKVIKNNYAVLSSEEKSVSDDLLFKLKKSLTDR